MESSKQRKENEEAERLARRNERRRRQRLEETAEEDWREINSGKIQRSANNWLWCETQGKFVLSSSMRVKSGIIIYNLSEEIEKIQKRAFRIILPTQKYDNALSKTNIMSLRNRQEKLCEQFFETNISNEKLKDLLPQTTLY